MIRYLIALLLVLPAAADIKTLRWPMAVVYADGSPVAGKIDRTNIWCGPVSGAYDQLLSIPADLTQTTNTVDINYVRNTYCMWQIVVIQPDGQEIVTVPSAEEVLTTVTLPLPVSGITSSSKVQENCTTTITTKRACATTPVPQQGGILVRTP